VGKGSGEKGPLREGRGGDGELSKGKRQQRQKKVRKSGKIQGGKWSTQKRDEKFERSQKKKKKKKTKQKQTVAFGPHKS